MSAGFEASGKGMLLTPHVKIANINLARAVAVAFGDLLAR